MTASRSVFVGLLLVAGGLLFVATRPSGAEEPPYDLRYLSITGEGSNAKAWFEGAAPGGTKVQEALDRFTREGYRFASVSPSWRQGTVTVNTAAAAPSPATTAEPAYLLLLERRK